MTTYELTTGTREDFNNVQTQLINDFISQVIGTEVTTDWRNPRIGRIVSCCNPCNTFESVIASVYFDDTDETKSYCIVAALNCGGLLFVNESMTALYGSFVEANKNIKHQWFEATQEARCRQKEEQKLEQKRKANEKKLEGLKVSAEKEFNTLLDNNKKKTTETDEFYYSLGWLAAHVGTISAKMPDFLEPAFTKHFGEVEHTTVDSTKVGPAGYTSQWRLSMEASLVKAKEIPATLNQYLNPNGKKVSKTSFVWKLVDDYGFKFGKKQNALDIMDHVPVNYLPMFNAGMKA